MLLLYECPLYSPVGLTVAGLKGHMRAPTVQGLSTVMVVEEDDDEEEERRKKEASRLQVAVNDAWLCKRSLDN